MPELNLNEIYSFLSIATNVLMDEAESDQVTTQSIITNIIEVD